MAAAMKTRGHLIHPPARRTVTRKYVHHDDGFEELYDLVADPCELDNMANDRPTPRTWPGCGCCTIS